ncbi:MAG: zinc-dependent metalloprotease, partial [Gemmatimonadales bacterium]|nr:zinc-dependent metalloprotease [Gemmatimonadales bacterium]
LNRWIREKNGDPVYRFGSPRADPRTQTEDIGDDPVRASEFGIANLKRVIPNLVTWTATPGQDYTDLAELYGELVSSWSRYVGHTMANIGGVFETTRASDEAGPVFEAVPAARQRATMRFLGEQVFTTPTWLVPEDLLRRIEPTGAVNRVRQAQASAIGQVLNTGRLLRLAEQEAFRPAESYRIVDLLGELRAGIWGELTGSGAIDARRRTLQREHHARLGALLTDPATPPSTPAAAQALAEVVSSDIRALVRADLTALQGQVRARQARGGDPVTRAHLADVLARIETTLDGGGR